MLAVKSLSLQEIPLLDSIAGQMPVSEEILLRIGRGGFTLNYIPAQGVHWETFPPPYPYEAVTLLSNHEQTILGGYDEGRLKAFAAVSCHRNGWVEVLEIRVDALSRRKGLGSALLDACDSFARRHGMGGLRITVSEGNPGLCQFLTQCGFVLEGIDRKLLSFLPGEQEKPLMRRCCALVFYRPQHR